MEVVKIEIIDITFSRAGWPVKTITVEDCNVEKALDYAEKIRPYVFTEKRSERNIIVKREDFVWIETRDITGCLWEIHIKSSRIAPWIEEQSKWIDEFNKKHQTLP